MSDDDPRAREERAIAEYRRQVGELHERFVKASKHPDPEVKTVLAEQLARQILRYRYLTEREALGKLEPEVARSLSGMVSQTRRLMEDLGIEHKASTEAAPASFLDDGTGSEGQA